LYDRTKSNSIFDAIVRHAVKEFFGDDTIQIKMEAQTMKIFFGGMVLARFKKSDENGLGCNIPTQAVLAFTDPEALLPGMSEETAKVEFTWTPNEIWTALESVKVVARDGDTLLWDYDIPGSGEVTHLLPDTAPDGGSDSGGVVITPKGKPAQKPESK
jgi:hypothetical protein